jgi:hypothetical protein
MCKSGNNLDLWTKSKPNFPRTREKEKFTSNKIFFFAIDLLKLPSYSNKYKKKGKIVKELCIDQTIIYKRTQKNERE